MINKKRKTPDRTLDEIISEELKVVPPIVNIDDVIAIKGFIKEDNDTSEYAEWVIVKIIASVYFKSSGWRHHIPHGNTHTHI